MKDIKNLTVEKMTEILKSMNRNEKIELHKERKIAEEKAWYEMMANDDWKYGYEFYRQFTENEILKSKIGISDSENMTIEEELYKVREKYSGVKFVGLGGGSMNVRSCLLSYNSEKVSDDFKKYLEKLSKLKATINYFEGWNDSDSIRYALFTFEYPVSINVDKFENVWFEDTISTSNDLLSFIEEQICDHYMDMKNGFQLDMKK